MFALKSGEPCWVSWHWKPGQWGHHQMGSLPRHFHYHPSRPAPRCPPGWSMGRNTPFWIQGGMRTQGEVLVPGTKKAMVTDQAVQVHMRSWRPVCWSPSLSLYTQVHTSSSALLRSPKCQWKFGSSQTRLPWHDPISTLIPEELTGTCTMTTRADRT